MANYYIIKETNGGSVQKLHQQDIEQDQEAIKTALGITDTWMPPSIPMGALLTVDSGFYIDDSGTGIYLAMFGNSDSTIYHNDTLNRGAGDMQYDGSDLAVRLHCKLSQAPSAGDDVGFIVSYAFIKDGETTAAKSITLPQADYLIDDKIALQEFELVLPTMAGELGGDTFLITIERNATGGQSDGYNGDLRILSMNFEKV